MKGFCPRCNSDGPAVDTCSVCKQVYRDGEKCSTPNNRCWPINAPTKALWWFSWLHPSYETMQAEWERIKRKGGA